VHLLGDVVEQVVDVVALEGRLTHQHRVEQHAEREDVGAAIEAVLLLAQALGREVRGCAQDLALARERRLACLGDPEVEQHRPLIAADEDVRRLDVAVDDAACVSDAQGLGHVEADLHGVEIDQLLLLAQDLGERAALQVLHHVEVDAAAGVRVVAATELGVLAVVEDGDDARVLELADHLDLAEEALDHLLALALVGHQIGLDGLDGDAAIDARIPGVVDHAHAAAAELPGDDVATDRQAPRARMGPRADPIQHVGGEISEVHGQRGEAGLG
jgi:hypothetical protein